MIQIPENLDLTVLEYKLSEYVWAPVLSVRIIPGLFQDPEKLTFKLTIEIASEAIFIQLDFDNPLYISFEEKAD